MVNRTLIRPFSGGGTLGGDRLTSVCDGKEATEIMFPNIRDYTTHAVI